MENVMHLSLLDQVIFIGYMVVVLAIGFWVARHEKHTVEDYFLAGDKLPWFAIGFSLIASSISTEQFVGEVGFAYRYGVAVANWEWGVLPAMTIFVAFFVPFYLRRRIATMPQYLEYRFGPSTRLIFAIITIVSYTFINLAAVLYSGGLLLHSILGYNIWHCIIVLAVVTGVYTVSGGLAAVVWTDVFQAILLLGGGLLVFILGYREIGGLEALRGTGERAHLMLSADHPDLPWTAMVVVFLITNIWYYATNQYINQRVLGAKNEWHARAGVLFGIFLGIFLTLAVCFPGLIAYHINPNLENPDKAYPMVVAHLIAPLGYGIRGLVFAGLIGAIMSTVDSLINSCSTVVTIDLFKQYWNKDATPNQMIRFGRISSSMIILIGVLWSPVVAKFGAIFSYFQECWVLMAVPVVIVFFSAVFWKRANNFAASATLLLSLPLMFLPYLLHIHNNNVRVEAFNSYIQSQSGRSLLEQYNRFAQSHNKNVISAKTFTFYVEDLDSILSFNQYASSTEGLRAAGVEKDYTRTSLHRPINAFNLAGILVFPITLLHILLAWLKPAPDPNTVKPWLWKPSMLLLPAEETQHYPWYRRLLLWWIIITAIFALLYWKFW